MNLLVDNLGKYVEGLSAENLKLSVWSGEVELNNLKLRNGVLDSLNLPISVNHASLKRLNLKIPWASLETKPIRVTVDGLYIQACPIDFQSLSSSNIKLCAHMERKSKLQDAQNMILSTNQSGVESTADVTYIQRLTAKIVDNLEILVTNIHIRYEDKISIPGKLFSCGITFDKISISTTDENWKEMFVTRLNGSAEAVHKLLRVQNFAMYWNTSSRSFSDAEDWEYEMKSTIFCDSSLEGFAHGDFTFIRAPPNTFVAKLIHNDRIGTKEPKIDLTIECTDMRLQLDKTQYGQVMSLMAMFKTLSRHKSMAFYRPEKSAKQVPRMWWKYAYSLVSGRQLADVSKVTLLNAILN